MPPLSSLIRASSAARRSGVANVPPSISRDQITSASPRAAEITSSIAARPPERARSSGSCPSGSSANRRLLPGFRCGSARSAARHAAFWPALSPSKQRIGSSAIFHNSASWFSVSAVPSGATLAGYPASVAPLGTALTENQLALLWKMADEPILCFDGDKAGQKAAWRAADLALPHLKPGKSLRFALLPEGQDPDDLARSGGRGAIEEVISAARGLADVIWSREIEGGTFATPERRAALEARIGELSGGIQDEVVRRYYRQDLAERLQRTFAPEGGRGGYGKGNYRGPANFDRESGRRFAP